MPEPLCFGHFEVQTRSDGSPLVLGRGAMGVTYKAFDRVLLSPAVVKVAASEHQATSAGRQRFLKEAQMLARVRHPHIASVFFFGDSPAGAFFAMEYCEGPNLSEYIAKTGPQDWRDVFSLGVQAAAALQALAEHELVHRDLKPSNFVITRDTAGNAFLKLIDFGIAREGLRADSEGLTLTGFVGTPAYASPEQLLEASDLDSRSDLYSLGSVLWFCLTGKPPFEGTQFEVMFHHANTQPDWRKLPEMPEAARAVLVKLLAKSPAERFATPSALVAALQSVLQADTSAGQVRFRMPEKQTGSFGGYEPLEETTTDAFGKAWRAKDTLTGNIVCLRLLPGELAGKSALMLRVERLVAFLRGLTHPRWQRVLHFEHNETQARLALDWVDGPTLLSLLKTRQSLPPAEAAPLLAQIAEAMDFAAMRGLSMIETAAERLSIEVQGWAAMDDAARGKVLKSPPAQWPQWTARVCPMGLSKSAQDYLLPVDGASGQASVRPGNDYVALCYRLLTGRAQDARGFVPHTSLKPATNALFEKHLGGRSTHTTCAAFLRELCKCEEVPAPAIEEQASPATTGPTVASMMRGGPTVAGMQGTAGYSHSTGSVAPDAPTVISHATQAPAGLSRMRELEERRAKLEAEAELLKAKERLLAEQEWIAQEREALEAARSELAAHEEQRRKLISDEQREIGEMRQALAAQQALLDEKQTEQQRLERQIQARAREEFQRLQAEAGELRAELAGRDAKLAEALRAKEAEARAREQSDAARADAERQAQMRAQEEFQRLQAEAEALRSELAGRDAQLSEALRAQERVDDSRANLEKETEARAQAEFQRLQAEAEALRSELAGRDARLADALREREAESRAMEQEQLARSAENQAAQARAQADFQRLQTEAEALRSELAARDAKLVDALHSRENEFREREQANLSRLDQLKHEAEALQAQLEEKAEALRKSELEQSRRSAREKADEGLNREALEAEERRLDLLRSDLDVRVGEWERGRRKRRVAVLVSIPLIIALAGGAAYYIKGRVVNIRDLPGEQQWQAALEQSKTARTEKDWPDLLDWCVTTDESLRSKPEFSEALRKHQQELTGLAAEAIHGILAAGKIPDGTGEQGRKLLLNLVKTEKWDLPPERTLLIAKLRIPEALSRGAGTEALQSYLAAVNADPKSGPALGTELSSSLAALSDQLAKGRLAISPEIVQLVDDVIKIESAAGGMDAKLLRSELLAEEARRKGQPGDALRILVETLEINPAWQERLRPRAMELLSQVLKLPPPELLPLSGVLRSAGDIWKSADAYLALADLEPDEQARADDYRQADQLGSMRARALVGRMLVDRGVDSTDPGLVSKGVSKLREAVDAGETEAMVLLGEAIAFGRGVQESPSDALELATRAEAKGHPEAYFLAAKARLRLGVGKRDATLIAKAAEGFEKAVAANLPGSHYFLYLANYTEVSNDKAKALAALEKGAVARDRNCLFTLGKWLFTGTPPAEHNVTRGRQFILDAAKLGSEGAQEWLRKNPPQ